MQKKESALLAEQIFRAALQDTSPERVIRDLIGFDPERNMLTIDNASIQLEEDEKIWILGSGKASVTMAEAMEECLGEIIADGLIICRKGEKKKMKYVQVLEGAHPIPDNNSLGSTYELIHLAGKIPENGYVFYLISGGTSALLCMPAGEIELEELQTTYELLLKSGATIHEMNCIRTVLSDVKGGQLLKYLSHTRLTDLIVSDVPGDEFQVIGSGPTTPVDLDFDRAFQVLKKYMLWNKVPHAIRTHIARGMHEAKAGIEPVPKPAEHNQHLVSSAEILAGHAARHAESYGFQADIEKPAFNCSIEELEKKIAAKIESTLVDLKSVEKQVESKKTTSENARPDGQANHQKKCLIFFGESTVNVTGTGKGGRNQELALRLSRHISPEDPVIILCTGTDGVDGSTDVAGAVVDGYTQQKAEKLGLDIDQFIQNNDSWNFFDRAGGHIKTGPTGNNLMDIVIVLVGG